MRGKEIRQNFGDVNLAVDGHFQPSFCAVCLKDIPDDVWKCPHCGREFESMQELKNNQILFFIFMGVAGAIFILFLLFVITKGF